MDLEGLSDQDFQSFYCPQKIAPNFDIKYDYRGYFPPLNSTEGYFSPKKNKCAWLKIGEHGCCGKPCSNIYCEKHLYMSMIGRIIPLPCLVCGVGVINFEFICTPCRLEKEKRQIGLVLAKQFENNEDWHDKTSSINASGC